MLRGAVGVSLMLLLCVCGADAQTVLGTVSDAASEDGEMFRTAPGVPAWDLDRWLDREDVRAIEVFPDAYLIPSPFFTLVRERGGQPPCIAV